MLVPGGGYCRRHAQQQAQARPSASARGYDRRWHALSRAWLVRFPWCGQRRDGTLHAEHSRCVQRGEQVRATVTDHIRSIRDGGAVHDLANLQSLCASCNVSKG